jgi:hypothetical protein
MVLREAQNLSCFASVSRTWKFKWLILTIEHDLHIDISLEIKFYIFWKFLLFFKWIQNLLIWWFLHHPKLAILYPSKNSKKFKKNINFDLQGYINMKIMFNSLDRPFELSNSRYRREARIYRVRLWCFAKHKTSRSSRPYLEFFRWVQNC